MLASPSDFDACRAILSRGSKSFATAGRLLPARLRNPVAGFYAFCRVSDDLVDESGDPAGALVRLHERLDAIYARRPHDHPADRALAFVAERYGVPRGLLDALLDGYRWDAEGRRYATSSDVLAYSARVAASVGVVMTLLMERRDRDVLARAADLGAAMQLTNIARDVGEDARSGRLYLPLDELRAEGIDPEAFLRHPSPSPELSVVVCRLLAHADRLYARAEPGIAALPLDCRPAIAAARTIYADIGRVIRARGHDSVTTRAITGRGDKVRAIGRALRLVARGTRKGLREPPIEEVRFLLDTVG
ncbi:MAG: phytoene/squalene synthase family protein [Sandaracinaceae bacterium]